MDYYDLAQRQHGVISREQLLRSGVSEQGLRTLTQKRALERVAPGVYRTGGSRPTWRQRVAAATLWLPGSHASHRSAAALHDLEGWDRAPVEVIIEQGRSVQPLRGVVVHGSKDLRSSDLAVVDGIPCTTLVRTLVDLPAVVDEVRAGIALDSAMRRMPAVLDHVRRRHLEVARRGRNGTVRLRAILQERGAGDNPVDSGFERKLLRLLADAGFPTPTTQFKVSDGAVTAFLDVAWPDLKVGIECDSLAHHQGERAFRWERRRRRMLELQGWVLLEFTYREVTREPALVLRQVRAARNLRSDPDLRC